MIPDSSTFLDMIEAKENMEKGRMKNAQKISIWKSKLQKSSRVPKCSFTKINLQEQDCNTRTAIIYLMIYYSAGLRGIKPGYQAHILSMYNWHVIV
jgi:hypothetical protein